MQEGMSFREPGLFRRTKYRMTRILAKAVRKIRGILDIQERIIWVEPLLHRHRRFFIKLHEIGHDVLKWHRDLFVVTSEEDLRRNVRRLFESEANHFAAECTFQVDDMKDRVEGTALDIVDLAMLASRYNASLVATARHYVSVQPLPAALLVGGVVECSSGKQAIRFRYGIANQEFLRQFGHNFPLDGFGPDHPACESLISGTPIAIPLNVVDHRGDERVVTAGTLYTTYETLTLIHPSRRPSRIFGRFFRGVRRAA